MKMMGNEMRKYEYVLDIYKGLCELNNYEPVYSSSCSSKEDYIGLIKQAFEGKEKRLYFYNAIEQDRKSLIVGGFRTNDSDYALCETIDMCYQLGSILGIDDLCVHLFGKDCSFIESNLNALDIKTTIDKKGHDEGFTITIGDKTVIEGGIKEEGFIYFFIDMSLLISGFDYNEKEVPLDAYVSPLSEEVLDDAFVIGSNLKAAGFKIEIDYSLKQVTKDDIRASFLITFDKDDIAKYQVKLVDMVTKEVKTVKIDNLVDELAFI